MPPSSTVYLPPQFRSQDAAHAARLMREHPFASLISVDDGGLPFVTHLPLHLLEGEGGWSLLGHCAKPNPHWRLLAARPRALVSFMGPHAYLSPQVYPDKARVPTWNYLAVHATVEARLIEEPQAKDALLKRLIADHEPGYAQQWRDLGDDFAQRMLAGIVGFELRIEQIECKLKLNQHRSESHAAMHAGYVGGNEQEQGLARWMQHLGLVGTAP
ncbi:FMN-binding negative transcriptional regulator [Hydrogenophaga sp. OTU3427]|uniref:FMN-binding negative transcriptional regulator n=1 Tax=Hydrogenophaga sp. OTU3427 TaxID=3043856 RepID=UPI00313C84D6